MPISATQARCNANALRKFGALVQLDGVGITGDFSDASKDREVGGMFVAAADPACIVLSSDVPAAPVRKAFINTDGRAFTVQKATPDGFGFTVLTLQVGR